MAYELRSYKKPIIKGHTPIPLDPPDVEKMVPVEYRNENLGLSTFVDHPQIVPGDVNPLDDAVKEAQRLVSNKDFWQLTICEVALDNSGKVIARSTIHWCKDIKDVQDWLKEMEQ